LPFPRVRRVALTRPTDASIAAGDAESPTAAVRCPADPWSGETRRGVGAVSPLPLAGRGPGIGRVAGRPTVVRLPPPSDAQCRMLSTAVGAWSRPHRWWAPGTPRSLVTYWW